MGLRLSMSVSDLYPNRHVGLRWLILRSGISVSDWSCRSPLGLRSGMSVFVGSPIIIKFQFSVPALISEISLVSILLFEAWSLKLFWHKINKDSFNLEPRRLGEVKQMKQWGICFSPGTPQNRFQYPRQLAQCTPCMHARPWIPHCVELCLWHRTLRKMINFENLRCHKKELYYLNIYLLKLLFFFAIQLSNNIYYSM